MNQELAFALPLFSQQAEKRGWNRDYRTYNYSKPWSAPPDEPPLIMQKHAYSGAPSLILAEPMGIIRFTSTACLRVHSWGAAVPGCRLCPRSSHTSTTMKARGCTTSNPATRAHQNLVDLFPQNMLYVSGDFHTFGSFSECCRFFKWNHL